VRDIVIKSVEEQEIYKFLNRSLDWFGLVSEIQLAKVGHLETETKFQLRLDWTLIFKALQLLNQWDLGDGAVDKIIELCEYYKYVNKNLS
jgi:hypothetical protein